VPPPNRGGRVARENLGTNVNPGLIARVAAGLRNAFTGDKPEFFGPAQPMTPLAQDQAEGRAFDYPVGFNLRTTPRGEEAISFAQLRSLADGYDLLRLVIETRKDQIGSYEWEIVPVDRKADAKALAGDIKKASDFLERPDKEHIWPQWLRMVVEELLVIDTICIYPRATRGGGLYGLELVDGATIKRVLDHTGRTPLPPDTAYQQILKGLPAVDYTTEDLVYQMRNPRVSRIYGYSPVEQVIATVNIAIRRQITQLSTYTEGNVPEAIAQVPASWTAKQIKDFQEWWDSVMEGNLAQKRKMRFIPNLDSIVFPKDKVLKDEYDEWLARIVCFAFSVTPSALIKQVNRASGEQIADTAKEEGLMPMMNFIASVITGLIQGPLGLKGLRFSWKVVNKVAAKDQATIHATYAQEKVLTPDEIREDIGRDKLTPAEREAAWPSAPNPGDEGAPVGPDGKPRAPGMKGATGATKPPDDDTKPPKDETPSPAEKMLMEAIRMLDPERLAKVLNEHVRALPPQVIEWKPEFNVEVGDTNVHLPMAKADPALAKRADEQAGALASVAQALADQHNDRHNMRQVTTRRGDGSMSTTFEPKDTP
jgi:PAS domain-containing protein